MIKKVLPALLALPVVLFLSACPDAASSVSDTPGVPDGPAPSEAVVSEAVDILLACYLGNEIEDSAALPASGVTYDPSNGIYTITGCDISSFSGNTAGYLTLSGTIEPLLRSPGYSFDLTLSDGQESYHTVFSLYAVLSGITPSTLSVSVNDSDYTIPYPAAAVGFMSGIPDYCGISRDTSVSAIINTPLWPQEDQRADIPSEYIYGIASKENLRAEAGGSEAPGYGIGDYDYEGRSYDYLVFSDGEVLYNSPGAVTLGGRASLDVEGINFPNAPVDMEYQAFGNASHRIYFSVSSDNPETTRAALTVSLSAHASLSYDIEPDGDGTKYAIAFSSFTVNADIYRMGWHRTESGGMEWTGVELMAGDPYGVTGYAMVGDGPGHSVTGTGLFLNNVPDNETSFTTSGTGELTMEAVPETEMYYLYLSAMTRSIVEFIGMSPSDTGLAETSCLGAAFSCSISASDPDHPGAHVTVEYYIAPF